MFKRGVRQILKSAKIEIEKKKQKEYVNSEDQDKIAHVSHLIWSYTV